MADDECSNSAGNGIVELEAMGQDSFSWHPCQISLCPRGSGLIVLYENNNLEERITNKEEVLARIRVRSTPLEGDDCSSIRQGELVIATKSSRVKGAFYDARVEEAIHVRHSKRIYCRCTFRIKWLHQAFDEEPLTVPSSSIMKLAKKSIHFHPTISTFFGMLESSYNSHTTPCPVIVDELHSEMDINVLLEKHIKEISNSTDISQEIIFNSEMDINVLLEKQIKEISNSTDISQERISPGLVFRQEVGFKEQCHARIIDASLIGPHVTFPLKDLNGSENKQATVEIPQVCISSFEGKLTKSRFLSPLAARAALASLRSEFPESPQFSAHSDVQKGDITGSFCAVDRASNIDGFSLNISAAFEGKSPEFKSIVRTLFPTSTPPNLSSSAQKNEMNKEKKRGEKINQHSKSRVTRSQARKGDGIETATPMTNIIETESKTRRVTWSTVDRTEKIDANVANTDDVPTQKLKPVDGETSECSNRDDKTEQDCRKRLTRSAAREETDKKRKLRNPSSGESNEHDSYRGNGTLFKSTPKENSVCNDQGRSGSSKRPRTRSQGKP